MTISLKTHVVYPEIQYDEITKQATGILYKFDGTAVYRTKIATSSLDEARKFISSVLEKEAAKYIKNSLR